MKLKLNERRKLKRELALYPEWYKRTVLFVFENYSYDPTNDTWRRDVLKG